MKTNDEIKNIIFNEILKTDSFIYGCKEQPSYLVAERVAGRDLTKINEVVDALFQIYNNRAPDVSDNRDEYLDCIRDDYKNPILGECQYGNDD
jgi:hypothetical protein